jgi:hypothetical protein
VPLSLLYAALTLAASALAFGMAHRLGRDRARTRTWPTTPGRILERGLAPMDAVGRGAVQLKLRYAYTVGGRELVGERVYATGRVGGPRPKLQRQLDALPGSVPVHYDPADPTQAFLLPNPGSTRWLLQAFGAGALLAGLAQLAVLAAG